MRNVVLTSAAIWVSVQIAVFGAAGCSERSLYNQGGDLASSLDGKSNQDLAGHLWLSINPIASMSPGYAVVWGRSSDEVYVAGIGQNILVTLNRGVDWMERPAPFGTVGGLWGPPTSMELFASGPCGRCLGHSTDAGRTWLLARATITSRGSLFGVSAAEVYSTGSSGMSVWRGPQSDWVDLQTNQWPDVSPSKGIWASEKGTVVVVGGQGRIARRASGQTAWRAEFTGDSNYLFGVAGLDDSTGVDLFAVGDGGHIYLSKNGSASWKILASGVTVPLSGVWAASRDEIFVVGYEGTILHSVDRGDSWKREDSGTTNNLFDVWASSPNDVYVVGEKGTILRRRPPPP